MRPNGYKRKLNLQIHLKNKMINLSNQLHFTPCPATQAVQHECACLESAHFLEIGGSQRDGTDLPLPVILAFCEMVTATLENRPTKPVVVCPEDNNSSTIRSTCMLCGAYLLLVEKKGLDFVLATFRHVLEAAAEPIVGCWKALGRASALHWLELANDEGQQPALDMAAASHYAQPANGSVHFLVPGKLLLAPSPAPLPAGQEWADVTAAGGLSERLFGAGFLADLLVDLDASAVVCLGQTSAADAEALGARGLDVHDVCLDPLRPALLRGMDRLVTVSRAAPGAVALVGGCDWDAVVGTLAAAFLMRECGFDEESAGAWLRLMCPILADPACDDCVN